VQKKLAPAIIIDSSSVDRSGLSWSKSPAK